MKVTVALGCDRPVVEWDDRDVQLPAGAAAAIGRYLDAVDAAVPGLVVGLHVVGSLALGDYDPQRSDIDVVAIVAAPPDAKQRAQLAEVHRVVATRVDGPYVPCDLVGLGPDAVGSVAHHVDGRFEFGTCHEVSPITWAILATVAITVRGDAPRALGVRADEAAVRTFSLANLHDYWAGWAHTMHALVDGSDDNDRIEARLLEWGVLGAARVHAAATTGAVVSKTGGASYARRTFAGEWNDVIDIALDSRAGERREVTIAQLRRACDFVAMVTDSA
jgi:Nucleotidyltransferase domain/Domain of unknown function (DUF4111)